MKFSGKIASSEFLINTATLIGGTSIAQVLPLIFAPLISRLFSTDDFSVYGVFVSIYAILGTVITLRYEPAVMLPDDDRKSLDVVFLSLFSSLLLTILFFVIVVLFKYPIAGLFNIERTDAFWLILVPPAAFFLAANNILITWFNRKKQYKTISANRIVRNGLLTGSNIGLGFAKTGFFGLILSQIISDCIAALYYLSVFFRKALPSGFTLKKKNLIAVGSEYRDFPKFVLPSTFVDTVSAQLPILLIAALYSKELSGSYFFAFRILAIPIAVIGSAFAQTFYQKFVASVHSSDFEGALRFMKRSWLLLASIIIVPALLLLGAGEPLFAFIFGNEWTESGKIASVLILYIMFAFVSSPTSTTYIALGMQKYNLIFSLIVISYRFLAIYTGYLMNNFYLGLYMLVCCEMLEIVIYNAVVYKKMKQLIQSNKQ